MKLHKYILAALASTMMLTACDNELDIEKKGNFGGEDTFYKTDDDAVQAITAAYASWNSMGSGMIYLLENLSDDVWAGGGNRGDNPEAQNLNEYKFGTDNSNIEGVFSGLYGIIYKANLVIERVTPDTPVRQRCVAEAYFFRGYANFYLGALFGTAPLVDHLLASNEYAQPNSEEGALLEQAAKDIKMAIDMNILPSKTDAFDSETSVRITRECAYAHYGKVLLWQGKNAEAAQAFETVINSGLYQLYQGDYGDLLKNPGEFCCESILENNQVDDPNTQWEFMSYVHEWRGWRQDGLQWSALNPVYSNVSKGYGFLNPRKKFYDAFKAHTAAGGGDTYRLDRSIVNLDFVTKEMNLSIAMTNHGNEGYWSWKTRGTNDEIITAMGGWNVLTSQNWRFMRYADVLLMAAEANLSVNPGKSLQYINEVRSRAHLTPLASVTLDDVKAERRFELCFEGIRYMDLVRWGDAAAALADQGKEVMCLNTDGTVSVEYTNHTYGFKVGKHERLPIPSKEMLLNPAIKQNPGWSANDVDTEGND